jgi:RHS repeat-associated protein
VRIWDSFPYNSVNKTTHYVWEGLQIVEERDSGGTVVSKRFYPQGEEQLNGTTSTKLLYRRDHLGSVRETANVAGVTQSRLDYDLWGNQTVLAGTTPSFGYTGHFAYAGLWMALYRAYDAKLGRWLNRDPLDGAELLPEGPNLYTYVANGSVRWVDPLGLQVPPPREGSPVNGAWSNLQNCIGWALGLDEWLPKPGSNENCASVLESKGCKSLAFGPCKAGESEVMLYEWEDSTKGGYQCHAALKTGPNNWWASKPGSGQPRYCQDPRTQLKQFYPESKNAKATRYCCPCK